MKPMKMANFRCLVIAFIILVSISSCVEASDYTIILDRMEAITEGTNFLVDVSKLKIVRKRSNYLINGTLTYLSDMDNSFSVAVTTAVSSFGNSHFVEHPYKIAPTPICIFHNTTFRKYYEPSLRGHTNYPEIPPEGLCPIPKGSYYLIEVLIEDKDLPTYLPVGLWRVEQRFYKEDRSVGGFRAFVNIITKK